jgi:DNA polymerase III sliding clamp (beta) subunit (PCNA family)
MKTTLTLNEFRSIASLGVFTGRDDVTPILGSVRIERDHNELISMTTNRYVATRSTIDVPVDTTDEFAVTIDIDLINKFITLLKADKVGSVTIELSDDNIVTLTNNYGVSLSDVQTTANYPPVNRLFPTKEKIEAIDTISLRIEWLVKLSKIQTASETKIDKDQPWTFTYYGVTEGMNGKVRPNAIMASRNEIDVLIQPNILLK